MEKHKKLVELHNQYLKVFGWDRVYIAFFDPKNKSNLDKKITHLQRCVDENIPFMSILGYNKLMDNYPQDIEDNGGQWDL